MEEPSCHHVLRLRKAVMCLEQVQTKGTMNQLPSPTLSLLPRMAPGLSLASRVTSGSTSYLGHQRVSVGNPAGGVRSQCLSSLKPCFPLCWGGRETQCCPEASWQMANWSYLEIARNRSGREGDRPTVRWAWEGQTHRTGRHTATVGVVLLV